MIIKPGMRVINSLDTKLEYGTIGGVVKDGTETLLLTCFHDVFHSPEMKWNDVSPTGASEVSIFFDPVYKQAGEITRMLRGPRIDLALIKPNSGITIDPTMNLNGATKGKITLTDADIGNTTLYKTGGATGPTSGLYQGVRPQYGVPYPYDGGNDFILYNLLKVWGSGGSKFSDGGDSGSFVLNGLNRVAGVIVLGDANFSYMMDALAIEVNFNINFT